MFESALFKVIVLAERAFRIIEVVNLTTPWAFLLRKLLFLWGGGEELELSATGAGVDVDLQRACEEVRQIPEDPSRLTEL